ncbi:hypothetical protein AX14_008557 [Amanita brunnescens Koide BX004]|nr:hypothetical protein AX14_008557 [Amanita brunnescens Koide BX004]
MSPWEGVRNYEARNIIKEMRVGEKVPSLFLKDQLMLMWICQALFYQSNCKNPGVVAFAEISKEAYPDYSAWDPAHPYYDPKTDKDNPRWFMVDLTFKSRAKHLVPLALLKQIAEAPLDQISEDISYIGTHGAKAIREMDLVTRGRLSVQRVSEEAWTAIEQLAERGGWDDASLKKRAPKAKSARKKSAKDRELGEPSAATEEERADRPSQTETQKSTKKRKRKKAATSDEDEDEKEEARPQRKSLRP